MLCKPVWFRLDPKWQSIDKVSDRQSWYSLFVRSLLAFQPLLLQISTVEREKKVIIVSPGMFCFLLTSISINVPVPSSRKSLSNSRRAGVDTGSTHTNDRSASIRTSSGTVCEFLNVLTSRLIFVPHTSIWGQSCFQVLRGSGLWW